jgi:hypothetical protein
MARRTRLGQTLLLATLLAMYSMPVVDASSPTQVVPSGWPQALIIPRLRLVAPVEDLSLSKITEEMAPYKWGDVGWYSRGPRPGDEGRASLFGHLDSYCCPAAFYQLRVLKAGDQVKIVYRHNQAINFRVMWQNTYPNAKVPLSWIYGRARERGLILMTCTGVFHPGAGGGYDHKLMVYARLVLPSGQLG